MQTLADLLQPDQTLDAPLPGWQRPSTRAAWLAEAGIILLRRKRQERWLLGWGTLGLLGVTAVLLPHGTHLTWGLVGLGVAVISLGAMLAVSRRIRRSEAAQHALLEARLGRTIGSAAQVSPALKPLALAVESSGVPVLRGDLAALAQRSA